MKAINKSLWHIYLLAKAYNKLPMSVKQMTELSELNREYHYSMLNYREPIEDESYRVDSILLTDHDAIPYTGTSRLRVNK